MFFSGKSIRGLAVYSWTLSTPKEEKTKWFKLIADDLKEGGKIFGTNIVKTMDLADFKEAT